MKLKALDQVSISSVKSGVIMPGEEFEVSDAAGQELLEKRPGMFEKLAGGKKAKEAEVDEADSVETKSEPAPQNKAEPGPEKNKGVALFGDADKKAAKADPKRS